MSDIVQAHGLSFKPLLTESQIRARIAELGAAITAKYEGRQPLFLGVLNGAFVFAADLIRACRLHCEISFIKLSSYRGLESSGSVSTLIGLDEEVAGRPVILVEDIIDTGKTLSAFLPALATLEPASIEIAALLLKPDALQTPLEVQYLGFEIPDDFVIGYGLDYDGLGRNLPGVYQLVRPPAEREA